MVKLPHHNGGDLSGKDRSLQFLEDVPLQGRGALAVLEPLHSFVPLALHPDLQLGALAVGLLASGGRYADTDVHAHANWGTSYFAACPTLIRASIDAGLELTKGQHSFCRVIYSPRIADAA
jgi:hypothetical protein